MYPTKNINNNFEFYKIVYNWGANMDLLAFIYFLSKAAPKSPRLLQPPPPPKSLC